jgi:hypothetical protein
MSIQLFSRCGVAMFLGALVAGCSFTEPQALDTGPKTSDRRIAVPDHGDECQRNRSRCMYEGAYEPTERDYAEQEAKRLNQAALERFRRSSRR